MRCCWQGPCSEHASAEYYMCLLRDVCHTCLSASMSVFLSVGWQVWKKSRSAVPGQQKWPWHCNSHASSGYRVYVDLHMCGTSACLPTCLSACASVSPFVQLFVWPASQGWDMQAWGGDGEHRCSCSGHRHSQCHPCHPSRLCSQRCGLHSQGESALAVPICSICLITTPARSVLHIHKAER